jgi:hypothetical protein
VLVVVCALMSQELPYSAQDMRLVHTALFRQHERIVPAWSNEGHVSTLK